MGTGKLSARNFKLLCITLSFLMRSCSLLEFPSMPYKNTRFDSLFILVTLRQSFRADGEVTISYCRWREMNEAEFHLGAVSWNLPHSLGIWPRIIFTKILHGISFYFPKCHAHGFTSIASHVILKDLRLIDTRQTYVTK